MKRENLTVKSWTLYYSSARGLKIENATDQTSDSGAGAAPVAIEVVDVAKRPRATA